jgi:hypothetical protein
MWEWERVFIPIEALGEYPPVYTHPKPHKGATAPYYSLDDAHHDEHLPGRPKATYTRGEDLDWSYSYWNTPEEEWIACGRYCEEAEAEIQVDDNIDDTEPVSIFLLFSKMHLKLKIPKKRTFSLFL